MKQRCCDGEKWMQFDEFVMQNALSSSAMVQWLCNVDIPQPPHHMWAYAYASQERSFIPNGSVVALSSSCVAASLMPLIQFALFFHGLRPSYCPLVQG